jgi:hypothetical protein
MDSVDHYATVDTTEKWTSEDSYGGPDVDAAHPRTGVAALEGSLSNRRIRYGLSGTPQTVIVGFAFRPSGYRHTTLLNLSALGTSQIYLSTYEGGQIAAYRASDNFLGAAYAVLHQDIYSFIEVKATIDDAPGGALQVRVNEELVLDLAGIDTSHDETFVDTVSFVGFPGRSVYFDDIYICDDAGAVNNDFLGDCQVEVLMPDGAGNYAQWTPSAGANYENVDEIPPNDDSDYNESSTLNQIDTHSFPALALLSSGSILGVQSLINARKTDAGLRTIRPKFRISGSDYSGANRNLDVDYKYHTEIFEENPDTGVAWTIADFVAGIEHGYELMA